MMKRALLLVGLFALSSCETTGAMRLPKATADSGMATDKTVKTVVDALCIPALSGVSLEGSASANGFELVSNPVYKASTSRFVLYPEKAWSTADAPRLFVWEPEGGPNNFPGCTIAVFDGDFNASLETIFSSFEDATDSPEAKTFFASPPKYNELSSRAQTRGIDYGDKKLTFVISNTAAVTATGQALRKSDGYMLSIWD